MLALTVLVRICPERQHAHAVSRLGHLSTSRVRANGVKNAVVRDDRALCGLGVGLAPAYGLEGPAAGIDGHARAAAQFHSSYCERNSDNSAHVLFSIS